MTVEYHRIESHDARLGRHVHRDSRSRYFEFQLPSRTAVKTVDWPVHGTLDQGQVGSCTGNALAQWLNTDFAQSKRASTRYYTETDAVTLYSLATHLDTAPGNYPPTDTGSDGLSVCKAGVKLGYLSGYQHVFGFDNMLLALQHTPVIVGTEWLKNMFTPSKPGAILAVRGAVE